MFRFFSIYATTSYSQCKINNAENFLQVEDIWKSSRNLQFPFLFIQDRFLQQNVTIAMPSLRTIQRYVYLKLYLFRIQRHQWRVRFDELSNHIKRYKLSGLVIIGEDATRVVSWVEYDSQTNKCVGFVLPINEQGIPTDDSYVAMSYEAIEGVV